MPCAQVQRERIFQRYFRSGRRREQQQKKKLTMTALFFVFSYTTHPSLFLISLTHHVPQPVQTSWHVASLLESLYPGWIPQSSMMVVPRNSNKWHDRPTSCPDPKGGIVITSSMAEIGAIPAVDTLTMCTSATDRCAKREREREMSNSSQNMVSLTICH
jgi:hypothetical protein